ncbi:MAG TPA: hypothetical protein VGE29_17015 [Prosthecobacter sp.]
MDTPRLQTLLQRLQAEFPEIAEADLRMALRCVDAEASAQESAEAYKYRLRQAVKRARDAGQRATVDKPLQASLTMNTEPRSLRTGGNGSGSSHTACWSQSQPQVSGHTRPVLHGSRL